MGATFTIEEKVSLNNLASQIAQVTVLASTLANYSWATLPGKPATFVYTDQLYSDPSWLSISKSFVGLSNVENTALSTWAGTSNIRNAGPLTIAGGTQTSTTPFINGSQVWNNAAVTFTGIYSNVTDTASNAASLLQDWQVGGSSKLSVVKTGKILGNGANPFLFLDNSVGSQLGYGTGILTNGGNSITWAAAGTEVARVDNAGLVSVASGGGYQWSSTSASSGTKDLILLRDAAATLAQRNGVNAQSFRVYNTYTDASNYERGVFDWTTSANILSIGVQVAGTGTTRSLRLLGSSSGNESILFSAAGTDKWKMSANGTFFAITDNAYDFGTNSYRPRNINAATALLVTGSNSVLEVWNTNAATSTVNYEKGVFEWATTANTLTIGTQAAGTGIARSTLFTSASSATLQSRTNGIAIDSASGLTLFQKAGVSVWQITTAGTFGTNVDGGQDIGNSGGQRPNNVNILGFLNMYGGSNAIDCYNAGLSIRARSATGGIYFATGGTTARWGIDQTGMFLPQLDATYDAGSSVTANRIRNGYFSSSVKVSGAASSFEVWNTDAAVSTTNYEKAVMYWSGNALYIGTEKAGTGAARAVNIGSNPAGSPDNQLNVQGTTIRLYASANYVQIDSSSNINPSASTQTVGTSGAPWNGIFLSKTITAAGTTGAQTINKSSGSVNFAAAATSLVVTNSLVTTSSVIIAHLATNDTTAILGAVVAAAGSFTIFMKTAPTAETRVNFSLTN